MNIEQMYALERASWFNFAFRTTIEPLVFLSARPVVLLIATFTVSFRAIRAAQTDPVKALRHE